MTTEAKVEAYLGIDISSSHSAAVSNFILQVTAWIEKYVGKKFISGVAAQRYFDGNGKESMLVDSFVAGSITSLQILDSNGNVTNTLTEGVSGDFMCYPLNKTEQNMIRLIRNVKTFPCGAVRLRVTAKWGVAEECPADVELVATKLVSSIIEKALSGGKLESQSLGDHDVSFAAIDETAEALGVYQTLDMYREIPI